MSNFARNAKSAAAPAIIVYHRFSDPEIVASDSVLRRHPEILNFIGYNGIERVKFINTGPLQREDWMDEFGTIDIVKLREKNVVAVDCGYGRDDWDHHRQQDRERTAIGRIIEDAQEAMIKYYGDDLPQDKDLTWLGPYVDVIEENDISAESLAIICKSDKDSRWPNVPMHFRTFLFGCNLEAERAIQQYADKLKESQPELSEQELDKLVRAKRQTECEKVLKVGNMACNGLLNVLKQKLAEHEPIIEQKLAEFKGECQPTLFKPKELKRWRKRCQFPEQVRSELEKNVVKRLFGWEQLLKNVRELYAPKPEYVQYFERMAEAAFAACQREWNLGDIDYRAETTQYFPSVTVDPQAFNINMAKQPEGREHLVNLVYGCSKSKYFGKRCRYGALEELGRHKADVICQIFEHGKQGTKFLVSTRNGITLIPLAYQLRRADLRKRYLCLETALEGKFSIYMDSEEEAKEMATRLQVNCRIPGVKFLAEPKKVVITRNRQTKVSHIAKHVQQFGDGRAVIILNREARDQLAEAGNNVIIVRNADWKEYKINVLYFAEFLSSFGNAHNTNPDSEHSVLTPDQILSIVLWTLRNSYRSNQAEIDAEIAEFRAARAAKKDSGADSKLATAE